MIWRVPKGRNSVVLTFDDGPHPDVTPLLLDLLARYEAPAVFFPVGRNVERAPELIRAVAEAGHEVGTHGYGHRRDFWRGPKELGGDIDRSLEVLKSVDVTPTLFRPPHGRLGPGWYIATRRRGLVPVLWNLSARDWATSDTDAVGARVLRKLRPGRVVLLHECRAVTGEGYHHMLGAVERTLIECRRRGIGIERICDWRR